MARYQLRIIIIIIMIFNATTSNVWRYHEKNPISHFRFIPTHTLTFYFSKLSQHCAKA